MALFAGLTMLLRRAATFAIWHIYTPASWEWGSSNPLLPQVSKPLQLKPCSFSFAAGKLPLLIREHRSRVPSRQSSRNFQPSAQRKDYLRGNVGSVGSSTVMHVLPPAAGVPCNRCRWLWLVAVYNIRICRLTGIRLVSWCLPIAVAFRQLFNHSPWVEIRRIGRE
jgi:hypothetical protein